MELFNLFAKLVLDSSEFSAGVADAQSEAEGLASSVDTAGDSFVSFTDAVAENIQTTTDNEQALADFERQIQESEARLNEIATAVENVNEEDEDFEQQLADLKAQYDQELDKLAQLGAAYEELGGATKDAAKETESAGGSFEGMAKKAEAAFKKLQTAVKSFVAYKVAKWFWDTTAAAAEYGDTIDENSQKIGLSAKAYQEWSFIALRSGTDIERLRASFKTLANQIEKDSDVFEQLGLSLDDLKKMSQEEQFETVVKSLQNMEAGSERAYYANKLLGRGAMELGVLLNSTSEDIDNMKSRVEELGGVMGERFLDQASAYDDALKDLQTAAQGAKNRIGEVFMGFNTDLLNDLANIIGKINSKFDEGHPATYAEELEQIQGKLPGLREQLEALGEPTEANAEQYWRLAAEVSNLTNREQELIEITASTGDAFAEQEDSLAGLRESFAETYDSISASYAGWFGAFDNATYEVTTSADEMLENLQSQAAFWESYEANLQKLSDAGFGNLVEAIESMGPAGAEYAEVLGGMVDGGDEANAQLQEIAESMAQVEEKRAKAAETSTAIKFVDNSDETLGNIDSVLRSLKNLDGKRATVYVDMVDNTGGMYAYAHAGGLDYVPYHNYPALLHEGERVLTKEENEAYTKNLNTQNSIEINQYIETKPQSPVEVAAATAAYFEQARWALA